MRVRTSGGAATATQQVYQRANNSVYRARRTLVVGQLEGYGLQPAH